MASVVSSRGRAGGRRGRGERGENGQGGQSNPQGTRECRIMDEILARGATSGTLEGQGQTMDAPEESMIRPGVVDLVVIRAEPPADPGAERQPSSESEMNRLW